MLCVNYHPPLTPKRGEMWKQMKKKINIRWQRVLYDIAVQFLAYLLLLCFSGTKLTNAGILIQIVLGYSTVLA